uniref:Uncharacterized protein n=1 Tax=Rhizophora mucronata TaxID=61149 RepID=A0A2P2P8M7_RHIMU
MSSLNITSSLKHILSYYIHYFLNKRNEKHTHATNQSFRDRKK